MFLETLDDFMCIKVSEQQTNTLIPAKLNFMFYADHYKCTIMQRAFGIHSYSFTSDNAHVKF